MSTQDERRHFCEKRVMMNIEKSLYWKCNGLPVEAIISEQPDGTWHADIYLDGFKIKPWTVRIEVG